MPDDGNLPGIEAVERKLVEVALQPFLAGVAGERERELSTISRHVEISLNELIHRQNMQLAKLVMRQQQPDAPASLAGYIAQAEAPLDELNNRLDTRRAELARERHFTTGGVRR